MGMEYLEFTVQNGSGIRSRVVLEFDIGKNGRTKYLQYLVFTVTREKGKRTEKQSNTDAREKYTMD